jgi:peroxiredoxin
MDLSVSREIRVPVGDPKLAAIDVERFLIVNVGETAPDFVATTMDGKELRLSELRGKVVLLDFWATWCGPCIARLPALQRLQQQHADGNDFVVVGISLDTGTEEVKQFIGQRKLSWPQIAAGPADKNPVAKAYNVEGVPATFLIDREGKVAAKDLHGWRLRWKVNKLLRQPPPGAQVSR